MVLVVREFVRTRDPLNTHTPYKVREAHSEHAKRALILGGSTPPPPPPPPHNKKKQPKAPGITIRWPKKKKKKSKQKKK